MTPLAETADRQSLWSTTAGVLKRRVEIARWVTFTFSIFGALLAAIASQLNDPARMYFAIAGAALLAVVSFVKSRLLAGGQITNWARARTASEALKREAYKYAASVTPYDDPLKRDAAFNSEREPD
jgi:drug/metabolite transporter (DMT)-like permease